MFRIIGIVFVIVGSCSVPMNLPLALIGLAILIMTL